MGIININKLVTSEMNVVTGDTSTTGYNVDLKASDLQSIIGTTRSVTPSARPPAIVTGWSFDILISYENSKGETKTYEGSANNGEILSATIEDVHKIIKIEIPNNEGEFLIIAPTISPQVYVDGVLIGSGEYQNNDVIDDCF